MANTSYLASGNIKVKDHIDLKDNFRITFTYEDKARNKNVRKIIIFKRSSDILKLADLVIEFLQKGKIDVSVEESEDDIVNNHLNMEQFFNDSREMLERMRVVGGEESNRLTPRSTSG